MTADVTDTTAGATASGDRDNVLTEGAELAAGRELTKGDLRRSFWRFFWTFEISWNYERMQALGFAYAMEPVLRRLFPEKDAYAAALQRHLVFFNTSPVVGAPLIVGSAISMEEAGAPASAEGIKVGLMGPMAGIGDTLNYALYNSIIFTIAASFALQGNWFGPIFALLFIAVPYFLVRRWQFFWAYNRGRAIAADIGRGVLDKITMGSTVFGLIVLGGFIPSIVHMVSTLTYRQHLTVQGKAVTQSVNLQTQLDNVLPYILPVAVTALCYLFMKKYRLNPVWVILGLAVVGITLGWFGWFASELPSK
jgi:mannose/fructose/N-acetylgalactosamine-specific phosphotransferase system component IID